MVLRRLRLGFEGVGGRPRGSGLDDEIAEAVLLGKAARRRRRRFGGLNEAVPPPQVALFRDQPLPGLQHQREGRAFAAGDEADLVEPAGEGDGRRDEIGQRLDARRQRRIAAPVGLGPMGGRRRVGGGVEIVAKRRAERRLVALGDGDFLGDRGPEAAARGVQQLRQGLRFRAELLRLALGLGQFAARLGFHRSGLGVRGFEIGDFGLERGGGREGPRQRLLKQGAILAAATAREQRIAFAGDLGEFGLGPGEPCPFIAQRAFAGRAARLDAGAQFLCFGQLRLRDGKGGLGFG